MRCRVLALMLSLAGCNHSATPPAEPPQATERGPAFRGETTYAALAERIAALPRGSGLGCLLDPVDDGYRFVGEPAPAISPMPSVDDAGFESALAASGVRLLSRWGIDGDSGPFVATFTHHPPIGPEGAFIVLIRSSGASLRSTSANPIRMDGLSPGALLDALRRHGPAPLVVFVGASSLRLSVLRPYLDAADAAPASLALGVALPNQVEIPPERAEPPSSPEGRCDALPALAAGEPSGQLDPSVARAGLASLRQAFETCASGSASSRVARGGRLRLAVRIDATGRASDACMLEDAVDDEGFRRCVLEAARTAAWPTPTPPGYVDLVAPLVLAADSRSSQRGVCAPLEHAR